MDINEILLTAMDTLVSKRLESINYDTTGTYTIISAAEASKGKYTVTDGAVSFVAYSLDTSYKVEDVVYVTIPNNDFNQQKIIVGKYVADVATPFVFTNPFDTLLDVSTNLVVPTNEYPEALSEHSLLANDPEIKEIIVWSDDYTNQELAGYTRLGIQARFKTWLNQFDTTKGDYGLKLTLKCEKDTQTSQNLIYKRAYNLFDLPSTLTEVDWNWLKTSSQISWDKFPQFQILTWTEFNEKTNVEKTSICNELKEYLVDLLLNSCEKYEFILSSNDMYGDPYNFESFYQQQIVFDISEVGKIISMSLSFYQVPYYKIDEYNKLGFFDKYGTEVPHLGVFGERLLDNIFEKDPYICVGYDLSQFDSEQAILYSLNSTTYTSSAQFTDEDLTKTVQLRWLHDFGGSTGILPVTEATNLDYSIYWYRYSLGSPTADGYSGVNWKKVNAVSEEKIELDNIENRPGMYIYMHPRFVSYDSNHNDYLDSYDLNNYKEYLNEKYIKYYRGQTPANIFRNKNNPKISFSLSIDDPWTDIYDNEFIYHPGVTDLHRMGFWEKVTTAFRFYWLYPTEFKRMGCSKIWETGGNYTSLESLFEDTEEYRAYGDYSDDWESWKGLRLYDITVKDSNGDDVFLPAQLKYIGSRITTEENSGNKFTLTSGNGADALLTVLRAFTDSFGKWKLVDTYGDGLKDFIPENEDIYNLLQQETRLLFECLENPVIVYEKEKDFSYTFVPSNDQSFEQIKAVVVYDGQPIYSNILTFTNEKEVANKATIDKMNGLGLWCVDESYGNYMMYDQGGAMLDNSLSYQIRDLECHFDSDIYECTGALQEATYIEWHIPYSNTMIALDFSNNNVAKIDYSDSSQLKTYVSYEGLEEEEQVKLAAKDKLKEGQTLSTAQARLGWQDYVYTGAYNVQYAGLWSRPMYNQDADEIVIIWKGNPKDGLRINPCLEYTIKSFYSPHYYNNTIGCRILKDGLEYSASKEFTFGPSGTNGTDYTLVLDFENNESALTVFNSLDEYNSFYDNAQKYGLTLGATIVAKLYDSSNKEIDVVGMENPNFVWTWEWLDFNANLNPAGLSLGTVAKNDSTASGTQIIKVSSKVGRTYTNRAPNRVKINNTNKLIDAEYMNTLLYLKVTLSHFGDYNLSAVLPIPLRRYNGDPIYKYITGATTVAYPTNGYAIYYQNEYVMHLSNGEVGDGYWEIFEPTETENIEPFIGSIGITDGEPNNRLIPAAFYTKEAPQYGVQYISDDEIYWTQPIYTYQNQYGNGTINKWDGKSIQLDNDTGTIVSRGIAAGKKGSNNTFSGVMLGDWSTTATASDIGKSCTGIFGFNNGAMSYAITDDGEAFFGKSGSGRILFNGTKGTITSAGFDTGLLPGMKLDLDGEADPTKKSVFIEVKGYSAENNLNTILKIGDGNTDNYLQSANFKDENSSGLRIDLNKGELLSKGKFVLSAGDGQIIISTEGTSAKPYLKIDDKCENPTHTLIMMRDNEYYLQSCGYAFSPIKIKDGYLRLDLSNGYLHSTWAMIGGWTLYSGNTLTNKLKAIDAGTNTYNILIGTSLLTDNTKRYISFDPSREMIISAGATNASSQAQLNLGVFRVDREGRMYCTTGYLGVTEKYVHDGNVPDTGWRIDKGRIEALADGGKFIISSANFEGTINGSTLNNLRLMVGTKFAVDATGKLYAYDIDLEKGKIKIGGWIIDDESIHDTGKVHVSLNANGTIKADQFKGGTFEGKIKATSFNMGDQSLSATDIANLHTVLKSINATVGYEKAGYAVFA